jgi:aldose 1-epimerase
MTSFPVLCSLTAGLLLLFAVQASAAEPGIVKKPFGKTKEGQEVDLYTLSNANGMQVKITNYGGIVTELLAPDRNGKYADVVLGFDDLEGYLRGHPFFGAIVGRYGNRIAKGAFTLDGKQYTLAKNNGPNHLHGGIKGFDKYVWKAENASGGAEPSLRLSHVSTDGDEGYPGTLKITVTYTLTKDNGLRIDYLANADKPTHCNLTNHSYFNLAGQGEGDILGHSIMINADRYTPVDSGLIPTGVLQSVAGTPFDFRKSTPIGARIDADHEQIKFGRGYDHNFVLNKKNNELTLAARVEEPKTGRVMEVYTTEPGVQFYCGNFLDGKQVGKGGKTYKHRYGFCLETQHFPDSPNKPEFPTTVLRPDQEYKTTTVYKFLSKK